MDLYKILEKHNIKEQFENAKKMDKENRIFLSESYVVKIYYPKKFNYYFNELQIYQGLNGKDYIPKLYYYGEEKEYKYIIISRLKGKLLFDCWNDLNQVEKRSVILQIANILKDINNLQIQNVNFNEYLENIFINAINKLNFSSEFIEYIKELYSIKIKNILNVEISKLIHIDIHFYNFFINDNIVYAYDFENTILAPLDYQLVRWYKMWKYPEKFKYPKNSMSADEINSYNILMPYLLEVYPELCSNPNFEERVKLYGFIYLLQEANRCKLSEENVKSYIKENKTIKFKE